MHITRFAVSVRRLLLTLALLCLVAARCELATADNLVVSAGASSPAANQFLGEAGNHSGIAGIRYEATTGWGVRADHSFGGDDAGNSSVTFDVLAHPFSPRLVLGGGLARMTQRLRGTGQKVDFHAIVGYEDPHLFGRTGLIVDLSHWSNGHFHWITGPDGIPNPPRNVLELGLVVSF